MIILILETKRVLIENPNTEEIINSFSLYQEEKENENKNISIQIIEGTLENPSSGIKAKMNFKKSSEENQIIRVKEGLNELLKLEEQFYTKYLPLLSDEEMFKLQRDEINIRDKEFTNDIPISLNYPNITYP